MHSISRIPRDSEEGLRVIEDACSLHTDACFIRIDASPTERDATLDPVLPGNPFPYDRCGLRSHEMCKKNKKQAPLPDFCPNSPSPPSQRCKVMNINRLHVKETPNPVSQSPSPPSHQMQTCLRIMSLDRFFIVWVVKEVKEE